MTRGQYDRTASIRSDDSLDVDAFSLVPQGGGDACFSSREGDVPRPGSLGCNRRGCSDWQVWIYIIGRVTDRRFEKRGFDKNAHGFGIFIGSLAFYVLIQAQIHILVNSRH